MQSIMEGDDQQLDLRSEEAFLSQLEGILAALQHMADEEQKLADALAAANEKGKEHRELMELTQHYQAPRRPANPDPDKEDDDKEDSDDDGGGGGGGGGGNSSGGSSAVSPPGGAVRPAGTARRRDSTPPTAGKITGKVRALVGLCLVAIAVDVTRQTGVLVPVCWRIILFARRWAHHPVARASQRCPASRRS